ncbi:MAG: cell division protein FtsZ [Candidatus Paceibacteria bacterium]
MPEVKPQIETFAKLKVVGVGGSGNSIVNRMVQTGVRGVDFWVMNTDVQALHNNEAENKLHIGKELTEGLGAGMDPEVGRKAAEEAEEEIREAMSDTDMAFVTCGLGGGTGSGASPVIARIAKDMGVLTIGVVTKPFDWEGPQRAKIAQQANETLSENVDTIITIPNDRILNVIDKDTSLVDAFEIVDDVLRQGVQGISELITVPGLVNVDFADVKTIMQNRGSALMGIGTASGKNRAIEAAQKAVSSPLLELSIDGAEGILFSITGGEDLAMQEVSEAAQVITESADDNAQVIFGAVIDEEMEDDLRITVIATGFDDEDDEVKSPRSSKQKQPGRDNQRTQRFSRQKDKTKDDKQPRGGYKKDELDGSADESAKKPKNTKDDTEDQSDTPSFDKREVAGDSEKDQVSDSEPQTNNSSVDKQKRQTSSSDDSEDDDEDGDLEIPAFIRKRMDS